MGVVYEDLHADVINYCYEVDDEIDVGNANDQVMEHQTDNHCIDFFIVR